MIWAFIRPFLISFVLTAAALAGVAVAAWWALFREPAEHYQSRGWSFEIPNGWQCHDEDTDTVCRPVGKHSKEVIMIGTTKTVDIRDTMDEYRHHVESPMRLAYSNKTEFSKVLSVSTISIAGETWLDARHLDSEVRGYETRYLAGRVGAAAVLVTFSCYAPLCPNYQDMFERAVKTIVPR